MATKKVNWGELEPKVPDNPKVFTLEDEKIIDRPGKKQPPKKKKPEMFFRKGGMVKGKGQNREYCK
jgi:hypothetical protein